MAALRIFFKVKYREDNYLLCCLQGPAQDPGFGLTSDTARWAVSQLLKRGFSLTKDLVLDWWLWKKYAGEHPHLTQHLLLPPNHILSALLFASSKNFLAGCVVHGCENREFV